MLDPARIMLRAKVGVNANPLRGEPFGTIVTDPLHAVAPPGCAGRGVGGVASVGALTRAGPDEGVAFAVLVVEEVRVDRRVERRIVELERQVVAALFGALRPGGPDFGPAHVDAVAWGVLVGAVGLGDDADALGLARSG